jgi:uncharacterized protein (TIGR02231 family)
MRASVFFIIVGLLLAVWGAPAQNVKTVASKATEATMFFRGAELTHTATVALERGANEVRIEGLSANIDVNSLKIKTTNNALVSSFNFSIDYLTNPQTQSSIRFKNLEDSIKICQKELDKLTINLKINTDLQKQLEAGITKSTSGSEKGLTLDELVKTMDFFKSKSEQFENQKLTLSSQKEEVGETLQRLQAQLEQENIKGKETSGILHLTLMASAVGNCTLTINYFTLSAGWAPYYDITVASADRPLTIAQKSKVFQTTGLDWDNVKLTLSTATPSNGKVAPLFTAWFLRERVAMTPALRSREVMSQNIYSYEMADMEKKMEVMAEAPFMAEAAGLRMDDFVSEADNALNITYTIDLPYSIPGNGKEQNIDLQTKETTAEYKYYSVPKLDNATYVLAEISDWGQLGLLSGKANVTFEGVYVGATFIDASVTHEKLNLTLGTDQRVSVKREKLQDFSATRFLGNDVLQTFTYKITVRNNQNRKIKMVVKDQYPISTQRRIEVALLKETTRWTANNEEVGVISWEEDFEAGETKVYQISYSVKYPKDMNLNL